MAFEEVKDDDICPDCGKNHKVADETISEVRKFLDQMGPGPALLKMLGGFAVSFITGGIIGLCYNHLAPIYLFNAPAQFHSISWWNTILLCFMVRAFLILVRI